MTNLEPIPRTDPVAEGRRISEAVTQDGVELRLTGGVAVALRCPSAQAPPLSRQYADIDAVGHASQRARIGDLLTALGYEADESFNAVQGARRLLYWDLRNQRQFDVFLDRVEMCHNIDLSKRLATEQGTLAPADLLLMKLQVVETNAKDLLDIIALLVDHDFTDDDAGLNLPYLVKLTSADWGLWRTVTMVAARAEVHARSCGDFIGCSRAQQQVQVFLDAVTRSPKSAGWRIRAKIGERVRWYEVPEDAR